MYRIMFLFLIFILDITVLASVEDHPDRVVNLPDAPSEPSFPLYSGYLRVDIYDVRHNIFYVLCESIRANPLEAPLVVWFNGGPGASSLIGFLLEHGPYILDEQTRKLRYNDFSWNQYANVLYIESPTNVGFSHANTSINSYDDTDTAKLNMKALHDFMARVHPRYERRDYFITGESYAGAYIPHLTNAIWNGLRDGEFTNNNFKGIAIGNSGIDVFTRHIAMALQMFAMGMVPQRYATALFQQWQVLQGKLPKDNKITYIFLGDLMKKVNYLFDEVTNSTIYNLHMVCEESESEEIWHISKPSTNFQCSMETMKNLTGSYMNREDVQKSLHAINEGDTTIDWSPASDAVFEKYFRVQSIDTVSLFPEVFASAPDDFRVLFYTGDLDLVSSALHVSRGTTLIAKENGLEEIPGSPKLWHYLGDFGGALASYKSNRTNVTMDVLTVRGAGHLVPVNHPSRAFQVINNFLFSTDTPIDYSKKIRRRTRN